MGVSGLNPADMGSKKAKTALDEIIAARNAKQSQKSVKQLYLEASGALNPKVSRFFNMFVHTHRSWAPPSRARVRACAWRQGARVPAH